MYTEIYSRSLQAFRETMGQLKRKRAETVRVASWPWLCLLFYVTFILAAFDIVVQWQFSNCRLTGYLSPNLCQVTLPGSWNPSGRCGAARLSSCSWSIEAAWAMRLWAKLLHDLRALDDPPYHPRPSPTIHNIDPGSSLMLILRRWSEPLDVDSGRCSVTLIPLDSLDSFWPGIYSLIWRSMSSQI